MPPIAAVESLKAELTDQPMSPLRPAQIQEYHDELDQLGVQLDGRDLDGVKREWLKNASVAARHRVQQVRKVLDEQAPRRVTGDRADRINRRLAEVMAIIQPALLPRSSTRRNPAGAVGHLLRTEFNPQFKDAVLTAKRALWALDPDNRDPDYTNMERFRPEGMPGDTSTFMAEAQIPGYLGFGPVAKANWPLGEPTARTAVGEARAREGTANGRTAETPAKSKRVPPRPQVYRCQFSGCTFLRRGGFGKKAVATHEATAHGERVPA